MIEIPGFIYLHTHTRYPDNNKFPFIDIDDSAINGGFSTILAMPNSEIPIESIKNLRIAEEIDKKLKMVELQLKKLNIDKKGGNDVDPVEADGHIIADRNELMKKLLKTNDAKAEDND